MPNVIFKCYMYMVCVCARRTHGIWYANTSVSLLAGNVKQWLSACVLWFVSQIFGFFFLNSVLGSMHFITAMCARCILGNSSTLIQRKINLNCGTMCSKLLFSVARSVIHVAFLNFMKYSTKTTLRPKFLTLLLNHLCKQIKLEVKIAINIQ